VISLKRSVSRRVSRMWGPKRIMVVLVAGVRVAILAKIQAPVTESATR